VKITANAEVVDPDGAVMPGLFACGEMVGGIFYLNYPGGAGLTNGAVFGRISGSQAGQFAAELAPRVTVGQPAQWSGSEVRVSGPAAD
jgi:tricarballylate dehydrogenase